MICKIVQNGGFIFTILYLLLITTDSLPLKSVQTVQEFCSHNLFMYDIEPGEKYQLKLTSEKSSSGISKWYHKSKRRCQKEFKTSDPVSHLVLIISNMSIPSCSEKCLCNYFEIEVPGYTKKYCGENKSELYSVSKTGCLSIDFQNGMYMPFDVTFTFFVERNTYSYIVTDTPTKDGYNSGPFIESPYFPIPYPSNYKAEYIVQSNDLSGHVLLLFIDYQISPGSFIEVVGHNGTIPARFDGNLFRPPAIISQSNMLTIKFEANNQPSRPGFRAVCWFVKNAETNKIYTDCGGSKDGHGGSIILGSHERAGMYDCIWDIKRSSFFYSKSELSVSILSLTNVGRRAFFEFREGIYSNSKLVKSIACPPCNESELEVTVAADKGLYIRFRGYLAEHSLIMLVYSYYHTGNCTDNEFKCHNGRCLMNDLRCDGIKHCPDESDETLCVGTEKPTTQESVYKLKSKNDSSNTVAAFVAILVFGICGLIVVVLVIIIIFIRFPKIVPIVEQSQPPQVISGMTDVRPRLYSRGPPDYDRPPSYDDFIRSSDQYPPLLYTRAKRCIQPEIIHSHALCTTSFCDNRRPRHHSAHSFVTTESASNSSNDMFSEKTDHIHDTLISEPGCSFSQSNVEWTINNSVCKTPRNDIRRSNSLDSKLNDLLNHDTCHFFLSIVHPVCPHTFNQSTHIHYHTLPTNFKVHDIKTSCTSISKASEYVLPIHFSEDKCSPAAADRRFSWSFVTDNSLKSEILTTAKTRCHSDPCRRISVHYSLYP